MPLSLNAGALNFNTQEPDIDVPADSITLLAGDTLYFYCEHDTNTYFITDVYNSYPDSDDNPFYYKNNIYIKTFQHPQSEKVVMIPLTFRFSDYNKIFNQTYRLSFELPPGTLFQNFVNLYDFFPALNISGFPYMIQYGDRNSNTLINDKFNALGPRNPITSYMHHSSNGNNNPPIYNYILDFSDYPSMCTLGPDAGYYDVYVVLLFRIWSNPPLDGYDFFVQDINLYPYGNTKLLYSEKASQQGLVNSIDNINTNISEGFSEANSNIVEGFSEANSNIAEGFSEVNSNIVEGFSDINDNIDDMESNVIGSDEEGNESGLKGILKKIKELPNALLEGIKNLFIPSESFIRNNKNNWDTLLGSRFGAIYQVVNTLVTKWEEVEQSDVQTNITLPEVSIPLAGTVFNFGGQSVPVVPEQFSFITTSIKLATSMVMVIAFIKGLRKKYDEVIGGVS